MLPSCGPNFIQFPPHHIKGLAGLLYALHSSNHSVHKNVDRDNHRSDKCFRLVCIGKRKLVANSTAAREVGKSCAPSSTVPQH